MTRWEYETLKVEPGGWLGGKVDTADLRARLNELGAQGWELASAFDTAIMQGGSREVVLVLKRAVTSG